MKELIALVKEWGKEKGITDPYKQTIKACEEFGELSAAILRDNRINEIDAFGDVLVTLIILADIRGVDLENALQRAYNEIKGRSRKTWKHI